jgi:hypothetical protein
MKNGLFLVVLLIFPLLFQAQPSKPEPKKLGPQLTFDMATIDYGTIQKNADPIRKFTFTNTGDAPLLILDAKSSCGCTVPRFPTEGIAPGASSEIEVRYDTKRVGLIHKTITITSNAGDPIVLKITGEVKD